MRGGFSRFFKRGPVPLPSRGDPGYFPGIAHVGGDFPAPVFAGGPPDFFHAGVARNFFGGGPLKIFMRGPVDGFAGGKGGGGRMEIFEGGYLSGSKIIRVYILLPLIP